MPNDKRFSVYVIELDPAVLKHKKFRERNPDHDLKKACLYVGMTARTPEIRFQQHKDGYKSGRFVRRYGKYLRKRLFQKYNPMTYDAAQIKERELAQELRAKGYAVWWN